MSAPIQTELPVTSDPTDAPWRPTTLYYGVTVQFIEPSGQSYTASVGGEIHDGEALSKLVSRVNREAISRCVEHGFPHEKHKQQHDKS